MDLEVLFKMGYGVYIVTSLKDGKLNGQLANVAMQVTAEPIQVVVCINKLNLTYEYIESSGVFGVSILEQEAPMTFIGQFGFKSGRDINKFTGVRYEIGSATKVPLVLDYSVGNMEYKVVNKLDVVTHTLYVGELVSAKTLKATVPMSYDYYHAVKRGKSPKTAPTFVDLKKANHDQNISEGGSAMQSYVCTVCGYTYNPKDGDPDNGIDPNTSFDDLPEDWTCPTCGVGKDQFAKE